MIKLHQYPDGTTGLAAFCDTCGEQITKDTERGFVVWNTDPQTHDVNEWRVIHQGVCDPGARDGSRSWPMSMPLDTEIVYLANSAGIDLDEAVRHVLLLNTI